MKKFLLLGMVCFSLCALLLVSCNNIQDGIEYDSETESAIVSEQLYEEVDMSDTLEKAEDNSESVTDTEKIEDNSESVTDTEKIEDDSESDMEDIYNKKDWTGNY